MREGPHSAALRVYEGTVMHARVRPKRHVFSYRVFALCLDLDAVDATAARLSLFSHNRFNALSFHDRDHGSGEATPVALRIRALLKAQGLATATHRIELLCYPRLLGFVFNPLSVYFCHDSSGTLAAMVYEVSNTFRERMCYVIPVTRDAAATGAALEQACDKAMYVSPFTAKAGCYDFHITPPVDRVSVGVNLSDSEGLVLRTAFQGQAVPLTDRAILSLLVRYPLMTLKVVAGIHLEALRLWLKGVPLVTRHISPSFSVLPATTTPVQQASETHAHVQP